MDSTARHTFAKVAAVGVLASMLAAAPIGPPFAAAQDKYPSRPVKIVVPLPAGTSPDVRTRIVAEQLTKTWGQQVVVENRPGGGGVTGVQAVLSAPADGYTLLAATATIYTILPVRANRPEIDVNRDLVPIGLIDHEGMLVAVSPKLGVKTLADLIALAKREPHKIVIGTNAAGTLPHLAAQLLIERSKTPMTVLPYATGGTSAAIADLMGGRVHAVIVTSDSSKGVLDSGDLKAVAVMTRERSANLPDLPTVAETVPGLTAVGWTAIVAPKGTPEGIVRQLGEDLRKALEAPNIRTTLDQIGRSFRPMFSAELARFIEAEQKLWWPIVKAAAGPK
jgi:tripartite-type tricarboxylate transporter receptor subunit TctC